MSGARLTAALECANDAGGRCALWPSGDAHACYGVSHDTATSCAFAAGSVSAARAALTGTGATPQSEGLVRVRTQVCFHTPAPVPWGRSRSINPYAGRRFERRFEAADHPFADRPAVWQPGITEQGRGTPDGSGHSPSRQVRDAPIPGDRWPSRTRESRSIRLGGSRTGTGLRVFALVGRTGSPTSMSPPTPLVKKPFAPQVSDAQIVQSIIERGIE